MAAEPEIMNESEQFEKMPEDKEKPLSFPWQDKFESRFDTIIFSNDGYKFKAHSFLIRKQWRNYQNSLPPPKRKTEELSNRINLPKLKGAEVKTLLGYLYDAKVPEPKDREATMRLLEMTYVVNYPCIRPALVNKLGTNLTLELYMPTYSLAKSCEDQNLIRLCEAYIKELQPDVGVYSFDFLKKMLYSLDQTRYILSQQIIAQTAPEFKEELTAFFQPYIEKHYDYQTNTTK